MLEFDAHGHPYSARYRDVYKSRDGAWQEALTVFVDGARLRPRWQGRDQFSVLELGFGLGVNFLAAVQAWEADPLRPRRLAFVSVESDPLDPAELRQGHAALGIGHPLAGQLRERWPIATPGLHRIRFHAGAVTLILAIGDVAAVLPRLETKADAFFLDGFAPARNPRMWEPGTLRRLARLANPGAIAATYTAAGGVRDALGQAGFDVQTHPGYGSKRTRLVATFSPRRAGRPGADPRPSPETAHGERAAIVVGAGLAGSAIAGALGERGWSVRLLDQAASLASGGSSQPLVADHPHLSADDNRLARATRAALTLARARETERRCPVAHEQAPASVGPGARGAALTPRHPHDPGPIAGAQPIGRLALARDGDEAARQRSAIARLGFPEAYARSLDRSEAGSLSGIGLAAGGIWFPGSTAADPHDACRGWIASAQGRVSVDAAAAVDRLERHDGQWLALGARGELLARAPVAILANAGDAPRLGGQAAARLRRVRGQTTVLAAGVLAGLRTVIGADAFACPLADGRVLVGSTFDDGASLEPDPEADRSNLRRLIRALAPVPEALSRALDGLETGSPLAGRAAEPDRHRVACGRVGYRWVARDRMPLIGALPDEAAVRRDAAVYARDDRLALPLHPGLFGAFAFGSRGLLWARLAAEVLAARLDGDAVPLETDLLASIDPARFLRGALRRGRL